MKKNFKLTLEELYQQNQLLISALYEIHGDDTQSASLFCLEYNISLYERNRLILLLNKFHESHSLSDIAFWRSLFYSEINNLTELNDYELSKLILLFKKNYIIIEETSE